MVRILSESRNQVRELYASGLSTRKIGERLKISHQAVSKLLRKSFQNQLKNRGVDTKGVDSTCQPPCQPQFPMEKAFRYHGLHIVAAPYYFYEKYKSLTAKGTVRASVGDWLLLMHKSSLRSGVWKGTIEFRQKNASKLAFMGKDAQAALDKAHKSFETALEVSSQRYGFQIDKNYKANVQIVREHLAVGPSGMGRAVKSHIIIRGENDKVWFTIDRSHNWEHEYTEAGEVVTDQSVIEPHLNDWRRNPDMPMQSQMALMLQEVVMLQRDAAKLQHETAAGMQLIVRLLHPQEQTAPTEERKTKEDYIG